MGKTVTNNGVFEGANKGGQFVHMVCKKKSKVIQHSGSESIVFVIPPVHAGIRMPSNRFLLPLELAL